jgi:hypothetical protein
VHKHQSSGNTYWFSSGPQLLFIDQEL